MPKNESATPKSYDRAREMTEKALDAFVDGDETGMINAVLDQIARQFRGDEFVRG